MTTYLSELRKLNPQFQQFDDETLIDALPELDPQRFAGLEPDQVRTIATETTREYEIRQYEEQGGGLLSSVMKGARRVNQSFNAAGAALGDAVMSATPESFQQSEFGQWLQGQADTDKQDVLRDQKAIEAMPSRPELNRAITAADNEETLLGGTGAFLGELWESPDKLGLFVDLTAEQLPNLAIMAGTTYATGGLGSGLVANSLRMGGSTAVASGATTLGSNTAEAMVGDLNKFGEAFNKAALQSGVQAVIDGTVGAMVPIKIGGRQLINMPAQSLLQVAGGSTGAYAAAKAGGDDITQGEILAEGLLELLTMPADVATAAMDARRGNRANAQAEQLNQEQQQEEENTKQRAVDYLDNAINDARSRLDSLSEDAPAPLRQKAEAKLERYLMRKAQVLGEEVAPNQMDGGQSETVTLMNGQVIPRSALGQLGGVQVNNEAKRFADIVYQNNEQLNQIEDPLERESAKTQSLSDEVSALRQRQAARQASEQAMMGIGEGVVPSTSDDLGTQVAYARYQAQRGLLNRAMNQPLGLPQSTPEQAAEFERYQQQQERNRSAFEGQHGTARNTAREGELLSNEQAANYSWANRLGRYGEVIDGETLQDPLQIGQPVEPQPIQQGRLSGPRGLGLPAAEVVSNQPERTAANPDAVSYSQVDGSEALNDAPSLRRSAISREVERARRSNTQTRFSTPQQAVIAEPYQPTAQEIAAREASRQAMEEPYSGPRQSRKARDEAYQLQKQQAQQLEQSRQEQQQRNAQRRSQENQVALGQLETNNDVKSTRGTTAKVYTPKDEEIDVEYRLVEAGDLTTSHDDAFKERADYPQALQNRDRSQPALRRQVEDYAKRLNPAKPGEDSGVIGGAPVVRNGIVESGNGRTMAIRRAYKTGKAKGYRKFLEDNAEKFGLTKEDVASFKRPVLVRQRLTNMSAQQLSDYTKDANTRDSYDLSAVEQANSDANRLTNNDIELIDIPESGDFGAASNRDFVRKFLSKFSDSELVGMSTNQGLTAAGMARLQNAVFAKAYQSDSLLEDLTSTSADDMRTIAKALTNAAPEVAKLNAQGGVDGFTQTIVDAVNIIKRSRRDDIAVQELTNQFDLMQENTVDATTASLANFLDQNVRSTKRMTDAIKEAAQRGQNAKGRAQSEDLFGVVPEPTTNDLFNFDSTATNNSRNQNTQTNQPQQTQRTAQQTQRTAQPSRKQQEQDTQAAEPEVKVQRSGRPFSSEKTARMSSAFKNTPNAQVVEYRGGYGIIEGEQSSNQQQARAAQPANQNQQESRLDQAVDTLSAKKREKAEKLAKLMKSRRGQLNSGIDPEVMLAVAELGAVTIAEGTVRFARWARDVLNATRAVGIQDEEVKPFLKEAYGAVSANPEKYDVSDDQADQMDAPRDVRKFDLNSLEDDTDVSATSGEMERAGASQDQAQVIEDTDGNGSEPTGQGNGRAERATTQTVRSDRSDSVPVRDGAVSGTGSTGSLFESDGSAAVETSVSDPRELGRSGSDNDSRVSFDPATAAATSETTGRVEQADTQTQPPAKHKAKWGDVSDIQQSVPALMPEQANDVSLIEQRLFDETSKTNGYLNTNGTGTGKTFVGLGAIKRLAQQGMDNTLIVLPSDGIARQWVQAAKDFFDLDAYVLGDNGGAKLKDAGKGLTITTYATFGQNNELIKQRKPFDLIVADESQKLMGGQQAKNTAALNMLRAHTNHERGISFRAEAFFADDRAALESKIDDYRSKIKYRHDSMDAAHREAQEYYADESKALDSKVSKKIEELKAIGPLETKVLFLSATPFPYTRNVDYAEGYLFRYEDYGDKHEGGYDNAFHGHNAFYIRNFGYKWRYHRLEQPGAEVDSGLMERQFHENMKELGVLGGRTLEVDADYKRDFIKVETAAGEKLDDLIEKWRDYEVEGEDGAERPYRKLAEELESSFDYTERVKLLEAIKAEEAVNRAEAHLAKGRKVVIFHSYNVGGSSDPLADVRRYEPELFARFDSEFPGMTNISFGSLERPLSLFQQAFGDRVRFYNGDVPAKARNEAKELFNQDGSGVDVIVVQQDAGEAGISLHDITGTNQRVLINIGIPVKPTQMIQIEGRIYRVGVKTDAQFENLTTGTAFERHIFAGKIAGRASTAENLGMGDLARSLKENISEGYLDAAYAEVGDDIGKGGKQLDRARETSPWDKAKSFYYSNLKRNSNTKSAEGEDYFATPEPLGMKMVEWLQPKGGDRLLEPSVGHGAIGRWFPGNTRNKATEKSYKLASLAEMVFSGDVINEPFEDLNVINKFEGIAMNPPFGRGGKLAYDHIEKAISHLTNGGRIVALVPDGPAANKRLDRLLTDERYENIYQAGEVALPNGVFDRAGTGVKTKVVILDRFDNPADAPNPQNVSFENAKDVNELFDRIEHTILRDRNEPTLEPVDPSQYMEYEGEARKGRNGDTYRVKMWGELPSDVSQAINTDANQFGARPDRDGRTYYFDNDEARADFAEYATRIIEEAKESGVAINIKPPRRTQSAPSSTANEYFEYTGETYTTKRGKEYVVTEMKDRQEYETYSQLKELAKDYGGWPRGQKFMFPTQDDAIKFNGAAKQLLEPADLNLSVGDNTGGMNADDVRKAVDSLINDLHEKNTFEVVQSVNDLPFAVRIQVKAKLRNSKAKNPVLRGINAGDKNYLIADGLRNDKEAVEIFLHEVVGHKAVLDMLGKDGDNIMERIAMSYGRKGLADLIDTYGADYATKEGRITLGKEKVAHMAERGEKPTLLKQLVAKVKAWLRKYFPSIKWSDNDVLSLISNARERVENRYMVKVDLDANSEHSAQEDSVNLSVIDDVKEKINEYKDERAQLKNNSTPYDRFYNSLGEKDKPIKTKFAQLLKRQFAAGGLLPDSIFKEKISRDGEMNASEFEISAHLQSFRKAVKQGYGKSYDELSLAQKMEINRQMSSQEVNKRIPVSVRASIMELRTAIKGLSKDYAAVLQEEVAELEANGNTAEAAEKAQLLKTILGNLDTYAHRSYRAFDDPNWPRKVPKDTMARAVAYLKARYESQDMDSNQAEQKAMRTARAIIEEGTAYQDMGSFIKESKLGAKDLSTLKRRKEIAPEIRELLGEYHDAEINFAKTATKMSRLVANHKFLKRVLEIGKREGFLFDEDNKPLNRSVVKMAADGSEVLAPLNGLYTYPEIEQAFRDALGTQEKGVAWVDALVRLNGIVKYSKTVLSPTTAMRNIWSAFFFTVANGHFDMTQLAKSLSMRKEYFGGDTDKAKLEYLKKLKRLGVVYDSPYAGEMMDLLHDSRLEDTLLNAKPLSGIKKLNEFAQKFYQYGDDMWKIVGFENEKALLIKHKRMSEEDAEVAAAERIRNTYPTYSMTGRFTQSLRRFPLAGTFVSFPAEIIRTTYHMLRYLKQDFKDSPEYAMRKVAGLALVSSLAFAAQGLSKAMMGLDDEEEEAVRDMAAPWQKNSNLMFLGRDDNGNVQYLDLSFLDPYNYFKRPINAILRDQSIDEMAVQSASEMLTPFFGEDITFGTLREIYTNKKETGGTVFNEQDSVANQTYDIAEHLVKGLQPGIANNAVRMYKAMNGDISASGKEYKVGDEMAALFGFRSSTVDPKTALYYQSFDFKQSKTDASRVLKHVLRNPNDVSQSELTDARDIMINSREQSYERMMRLVKSAKKSGMSNAEIRKVLKLSGISQKDIMSLMLGRMPKEDDYTKMAETIAERASILYGADAGREVTRRANSL